jgi:DNA-binding NarL/FixJ family response regulator
MAEGEAKDSASRVSADEATGDRVPQSGPERPRVVIADDDATVLEEVAALLGARFDVVARVPNGRVLVETVREILPALAVVDVSMPEMNGIRAARRITRECPGVKVVMLSVHDDADYVEAAFEAGASGYVLKIRLLRELIPAIDRVLAGESYRPAGGIPQTDVNRGLRSPHSPEERSG